MVHNVESLPENRLKLSIQKLFISFVNHTARYFDNAELQNTEFIFWKKCLIKWTISKMNNFPTKPKL